MVELKASTKRGQSVIKMGEGCRYKSLSYLYNSWSTAKQRAYNDCYARYIADPNSTAFGVGGATSFGFTCSWLTIKDGENVLIVRTKSTDYLVWLDR